jgi:hypothetical protein
MERPHRPPERWNRAEVSHYLVPFLRWSDALRADPELTDAPTKQDVALLAQTAQDAYAACPAAYRQLFHVHQSADDDTYDRWFGGIDCDDALLNHAFGLIGQMLSQQLPALRKQQPLSQVRAPIPEDVTVTPAEPLPKDAAPAAPTAGQLSEDAALRRLLRVSHTYTDAEGQIRTRQLDLLTPFLEFCRATDTTARQRLQERCLAAVQTHPADYVHVLTLYRQRYADPGTSAHTALLQETHDCMRLIEHLLARCDYETALSDKKAALEYERGGLGWFGRTRKREIDKALHELSLTELRLRIEDERVRLQTECEPLERKLQRMETELEHAPLTAFARKKELRASIKQTQAALADLHAQSELEALTEQLSRLERKKRR